MGAIVVVVLALGALLLWYFVRRIDGNKSLSARSTGTPNTTPSTIFALVVGINTYQHPDVANLSGAISDARNFADLLRGRFNVPQDNVCLLLDATQQVILDAFDALFLTNPLIRPGDTLILFSAGHGTRFGDGFGGHIEGFCPSDFNMPDDDGTPRSGILDHQLNALLKAVVARHRVRPVVISDFCHSAGATRSTSLPMGRVRSHSMMPLAPLSTLLPPPFYASDETTHVLLAACEPHEFAYEKESGGDFSVRLMKRLEVASLNGHTYRQLINEMEVLQHQHPQCLGAGADTPVFSASRAVARGQRDNSGGLSFSWLPIFVFIGVLNIVLQFAILAVMLRSVRHVSACIEASTARRFPDVTVVHLIVFALLLGVFAILAAFLKHISDKACSRKSFSRLVPEIRYVCVPINRCFLLVVDSLCGLCFSDDLVHESTDPLFHFFLVMLSSSFMLCSLLSVCIMVSNLRLSTFSTIRRWIFEPRELSCLLSDESVFLLVVDSFCCFHCSDLNLANCVAEFLFLSSFQVPYYLLYHFAGIPLYDVLHFSVMLVAPIRTFSWSRSHTTVPFSTSPKPRLHPALNIVYLYRPSDTWHLVQIAPGDVY